MYNFLYLSNSNRCKYGMQYILEPITVAYYTMFQQTSMIIILWYSTDNDHPQNNGVLCHGSHFLHLVSIERRKMLWNTRRVSTETRKIYLFVKIHVWNKNKSKKRDCFWKIFCIFGGFCYLMNFWVDVAVTYLLVRENVWHVRENVFKWRGNDNFAPNEVIVL